MTNTKAAPRARRHLILIDIENLAATPRPTLEDVETVVRALRKAVPGYDDDQKVVACSHYAALVVAFCVPGARQLWRSGPDGADRALLDVLQNERVDERFDRITVCSGDGIFTDAVALLAHAGVEVTAVSLAGRLSARLQLAARHVTLLSPAQSVAAGSAS